MRKGSYATMKEYNVTEFRQNALALISGVANSRLRFSVSKRNTRQAVVLPKEFSILAEPNVEYRKWMALMFVERLMPDAPEHIKEPQRLEFEQLAMSKLTKLLQVEALPLREEVKRKLNQTVGKEIIDRLEKRYRIAQAIILAEKENLYEIFEDQTGHVDLN